MGKHKEETIEYVKYTREKRDKQYLIDTADEINNGFFRKLFKLKPISHNDAICYINNCTNAFAHLYYPSEAFDGSLKTAKRLLVAAKESEDYVYVSSSDLLKIK